MLEALLLSSVIWFPLCSVAFLFGYIRGSTFDACDWSEGYDAGYRAGKNESESDEEKYGLNV
jgi:hypothetical protein